MYISRTPNGILIASHLLEGGLTHVQDENFQEIPRISEEIEEYFFRRLQPSTSVQYICLSVDKRILSFTFYESDAYNLNRCLKLSIFMDKDWFPDRPMNLTEVIDGKNRQSFYLAPCQTSSDSVSQFVKSILEQCQ